jgi:sterol desaturase/sphingolipid hydroxylase (fatty acid hydroxylase superfamily)
MELFNRPSVAWVYLPALLLAMAVEAILLMRRHGRYPWQDSLSSLVIATGHALAGAVSYGIVTTGVALFVWRFRLTTIDLRRWEHVLLLGVLVDFSYYWYHRAAHRIRLLWVSHSVHHSPEQLTLFAACRLTWMPVLLGSWLFFLPLVWIGFDPRWVFGMLSTSLLYQFWLHTTLIPRLGVLEWVFNTPSAHRVHHGSNDEYLDRNYGGVLIVFDRLFGSYVAEDPATPVRFGLVHPVMSRNPVMIVFGECLAALRDLRQVPSWRDRLRMVFAPPGWQPPAARRLTSS